MHRIHVYCISDVQLGTVYAILNMIVHHSAELSKCAHKIGILRMNITSYNQLYYAELNKTEFKEPKKSIYTTSPASPHSMKATTATTPKLNPTLAMFRPTPAVTTGVDTEVALAEAEPAPATLELVGITVAKPEVLALANDDTVPFL